jgi:hypothetical protein
MLIDSTGGQDVDGSTARSRRAVLGAGLGALAATVAAAIGRPAPARAEGEAIHLGEELTTAQSLTRIRNETNDADVFYAESAGSGTAIAGIANHSTGVAGTSGDGIGVYAGTRPASGHTPRLTRESRCGQPDLWASRPRVPPHW